MNRIGLSLIGIIALAACEEMPPPAPLQGESLVEALVVSATSPDTPVLGTQSVPGRTAVEMFAAICLDTAPSFRGAPAVLQANSFVQNPATGTWYHPTLNLSAHISDDCSMVFGSTDEPGPLLMALGIITGAASGPEPTIGVDEAGGAVIAQGPAGTVALIETSGRTDGELPLFHAVLGRP